MIAWLFDTLSLSGRNFQSLGKKEEKELGCLCSGYHYCTASFNKIWSQVLCGFQCEILQYVGQPYVKTIRLSLNLPFLSYFPSSLPTLTEKHFVNQKKKTILPQLFLVKALSDILEGILYTQRDSKHFYSLQSFKNILYGSRLQYPTIYLSRKGWKSK